LCKKNGDDVLHWVQLFSLLSGYIFAVVGSFDGFANLLSCLQKKWGFFIHRLVPLPILSCHEYGCVMSWHESQGSCFVSSGMVPQAGLLCGYADSCSVTTGPGVATGTNN